MKKIDLVVGARPNFIKAFPVYRALGELDYFDLRLINTGQHYDPNMVDVFFKQLNMKKPDINLGIGSGNHGQQTGKVLIEIEKVFIEKIPDLVIVFGDVNSTIAVALAAKKLHIPVAHVEAGLRSFDRSMPEEINRILTDQISELLFITSPEAETNLNNEGVSHYYSIPTQEWRAKSTLPDYAFLAKLFQRAAAEYQSERYRQAASKILRISMREYFDEEKQIFIDPALDVNDYEYLMEMNGGFALGFMGQGIKYTRQKNDPVKPLIRYFSGLEVLLKDRLWDGKDWEFLEAYAAYLTAADQFLATETNP